MAENIFWAEASADLAASASRIRIAAFFGQGATMVSAIWGIFVWKEFSNAPISARKLVLPMFLGFILGLAAVAIAPVLAQ